MEKPIGIFDSGIGGLTVANAIRKKLTKESILYFGDTAHLPYGDKSPESIRHYAARITAFLIQKKCKAIVIACNTASSHAYQTVVDIAGPDIPVINVIDPVVAKVVERHSGEKVGVIATKGTIESRVYQKRIKKKDQSIKVAAVATPLLAPMIEEGFFNNQISQTIINSYLAKQSLKDLQALVLGCTHYPLIKREVKSYYTHKVDILDSPSIVASEVFEVLSWKQLLAEKNQPTYEFMVSDKTESFERSTKFFFKQKIALEEVRLFDL